MIFSFERKIDRLGRIVIPKDLRRTLQLLPGDSVTLVFDGNALILKKK